MIFLSCIFLTLSLYGFCYTSFTQLKGGIIVVMVAAIMAILMFAYLVYDLFWGENL